MSTFPILSFDRGTLILKNWEGLPPPFFVWDSRSLVWRAPGYRYRELWDIFSNSPIEINDQVKAFSSVDFEFHQEYALYPFQKEALCVWMEAGKRGLILLPTGAGKTILSLHAIREAGVSTLVVVPTIDLLNQWYSLLLDTFGIPVGILGAGYHEIREITVATYDSAYRYMDKYGNRFGLLVFDEAHHLPSPAYSQIAILSVALYRLGLTATYRKNNEAFFPLETLIGPIVYQKKVRDLEGDFLAPFEIRKIRVRLTASEQAVYKKEREKYVHYVHEHGIRYYGNRWKQFVAESGKAPEAREALLARKRFRSILFGAEKKLEILETILKQHFKDTMLIFTENNDLVYTISKTFFIPAITHETGPVERKRILDFFKQGKYRAIVTSKVLNEGVDVPEANVAVILGGSANPREQIQRLGRILRKRHGKKAILYEVITAGTEETQISYRRRKGNVDP